jgi:hypothetical protein
LTSEAKDLLRRQISGALRAGSDGHLLKCFSALGFLLRFPEKRPKEIAKSVDQRESAFVYRPLFWRMTTMAVPKRAESRSDQRREERLERFSGEFSCRLIANDDDTRQVPIRPLDVSRRGLGFLVREPLKPGGFFWLQVGKERFRTELAYCNGHLGIDNLYRCGLFLREADGDLAATFVRAGLLLEERAT